MRGAGRIPADGLARRIRSRSRNERAREEVSFDSMRGCRTCVRVGLVSLRQVLQHTAWGLVCVL